MDLKRICKVWMFCLALFLAGMTAQALPATFDSRETREIPAVADQKTEQTCWALTAAATLEASMEQEKAIEFSSEHIVERNIYHPGRDAGGDYLMLMSYLANWRGPVSKEWEEGQETAPVVHVQDVELIPQDEKCIKEAVYMYGAVQVSLHMNREKTEDPLYYKKEKNAYYCPETDVLNHDVMIIGWDDTFPASAFGTDPGMDGAYLCQNTWGTDFGMEGLFYVSYADANLGKVALAYTRIEPTDNYDMICQTDDYGWSNRQGFDAEECWFANVYEISAPEYLEAAGFYAVGPDTSYEIYLVKDAKNVDDFSRRELIGSGSFKNGGYHTVDFSNPIKLEANQKFALIVFVRTPDCETPVAVEYADDERTPNVKLDGKFGYISQYGDSWHHTEKRYKTNVCLKAYLNNTERTVER